MKDAYDKSDTNFFEKVVSYEKLCTPSSEHGLNVSNVQKIIHGNDLHFDLVINEDMFHESWLMFAHKFNTPIITICKLFYFLFCSVSLYEIYLIQKILLSNQLKVPMDIPIFSIGQWEC